jgi:hypothetical protein
MQPAELHTLLTPAGIGTLTWFITGSATSEWALRPAMDLLAVTFQRRGCPAQGAQGRA